MRMVCLMSTDGTHSKSPAWLTLSHQSDQTAVTNLKSLMPPIVSLLVVDPGCRIKHC